MFNDLHVIAKFLIILGIVIAGFGVLLLILKNSGIPFFKLPGDIVIEKKNFTIYFPLATSILLSVLLTVIMYLISRK